MTALITMISIFVFSLIIITIYKRYNKQQVIYKLSLKQQLHNKQVFDNATKKLHKRLRQYENKNKK